MPLSIIGYPDLEYQPTSLPIGVLNFASHLRDAMVNGLGTTVHHNTAYHPLSNGLVERFHRKPEIERNLEG